MTTFHLVISAYNSVVFKGPAVYLQASNVSGNMGIEAHHENFFLVLKADSTLSYQTPEGKTFSQKILSGLMHFLDNTCTAVVELNPDPRTPES